MVFMFSLMALWTSVLLSSDRAPAWAAAVAEEVWLPQLMDRLPGRGQLVRLGGIEYPARMGNSGKWFVGGAPPSVEREMRKEGGPVPLEYNVSLEVRGGGCSEFWAWPLNGESEESLGRRLEQWRMGALRGFLQRYPDDVLEVFMMLVAEEGHFEAPPFFACLSQPHVAVVGGPSCYTLSIFSSDGEELLAKVKSEWPGAPAAPSYLWYVKWYVWGWAGKDGGLEALLQRARVCAVPMESPTDGSRG